LDKSIEKEKSDSTPSPLRSKNKMSKLRISRKSLTTFSNHSSSKSPKNTYTKENLIQKSQTLGDHSL